MIGATPLVEPLNVIMGVDLTFAVAWSDKNQAPIPMSAARAAIVDDFESGDVLYDLDSYIVVVGNVATITVPGDVTATWLPLTGEWQFQGTAAGSGQKLAFIRGKATIVKGI